MWVCECLDVLFLLWTNIIYIGTIFFWLWWVWHKLLCTKDMTALYSTCTVNSSLRSKTVKHSKHNYRCEKSFERKESSFEPITGFHYCMYKTTCIFQPPATLLWCYLSFFLVIIFNLLNIFKIYGVLLYTTASLGEYSPACQIQID